jgi:hypothetical protein
VLSFACARSHLARSPCAGPSVPFRHKPTAGAARPAAVASPACFLHEIAIAPGPSPNTPTPQPGAGPASLATSHTQRGRAASLQALPLAEPRSMASVPIVSRAPAPLDEVIKDMGRVSRLSRPQDSRRRAGNNELSVVFSLGLELVPPPCARPPMRPVDAHGEGTTICGRAIGSWSGSPRTEFEVNLVTEVLSSAAAKGHLALGVIEAAEQAGSSGQDKTVIEATSGNTGIGLAMVCIFWEAKLGP